MPICKRFRERLPTITTFTGVPLFDALVSLNLENRDLDPRNLRLMLKISYTAFPNLSQLILAQFAFEMCLAVRNRQKLHKKTSILAFKVIRGH